MSDLTIAKTILEQLGGKKFQVMTGAKSPVGGSNDLSFKFMKNSSKSNYCHITLEPSDTYTVEFFHIHSSGKWPMYQGKVIDKTFENVYNDNLVEIFEDYTGLRTSL